MLNTLTPADLVLGPRPGKKSMNRLSELGLTHCCTLLSEKEDPNAIKRICGRLGCEWIWLPVDGGGLDTLKAVPIADYVHQLDEALGGIETPKVYLHCSAGIHRTGYVVYILLRLMGLDEADALKTLNELRPVTAEQVGSERIALAEAVFQECWPAQGRKKR